VYVSGFPRSSGTVLIVERDGSVTALVPALDYWRAVDNIKLEKVTVVPYATYELPDIELKLVQPPHVYVPEVLKGHSIRKVGVDNPYSRLVSEVEKTLGSKVLDLSEEIADARAIKHEEELELMRRALHITERSVEKVLKDLKPGVSEKAVAALVEYYMRSGGADGLAFETIVAFGPDAAYPHATVTDRTLREKDVVVMDLGAQVSSYSSDLTRTALVGNVGEVRKVAEVVSEAVAVSIDSVKDGVPAEEVDGRARDVIRRSGYGKYFVHSLGHGVGIEVHEKPRIAQGSKDVLRDGMVVTIEPGVYIPGRFGVRIENMVVVRKYKAEVLNSLATIIEV
jgi:Xaa-Pro dipeptidase